MWFVNQRIAALVLAISGLGLAAYGVLVDASTMISCPPLPEGAICQAVLVKEIGQSFAILGTIIFVVGIFLFASWKRRERNGMAKDAQTVLRESTGIALGCLNLSGQSALLGKRGQDLPA